jgi:hypothetical protein
MIALRKKMGLSTDQDMMSVNYRSYAVARQAGGVEGRRPSKNHPFLVLFAGLAGKEHEKKEISGRLAAPNPTTA